MSELLQTAIIQVKTLTEVEQDRIAMAMLELANAFAEPGEIPPEDLPAVLQGMAEADAGMFASDDEVEAVFKRFRA